ncbi:MAG: NAD-dependent epimerase/dehydratase family protein [Phycisphaerae bacterium]
MKILVTGGSGFIGTPLVGELLKERHQVTIFDKDISCKYPDIVVLGDVRDKDAIIKAAAKHDVIYHLAAEHKDDVRPISLYDDVNVGGARNVVAAANNAGIKKIIFTSTVAIYPLNADMPDEQSKISPFNKYGQSKYEAEKVFNEWVSQDNKRSLVIVRPVAIFGENNRGNVYNLLLQIYKRRFIMVGNGRNKKSIGYIGNIVRFLTFCLDFGPGSHLFNYVDKPDMSTNELVRIAKHAFGRDGNYQLRIPYSVGLLAGYGADLVARVSGKTLPVSPIRIKKFCANTTVSADRLLKTGFNPPYSIKEALQHTIKAEFSSHI